MQLLVRLATVCPTDPFDGFFAWVGCSFVKAMGVDPDKMHGDLISSLLSAPPPSANGSCSSLLESLMGQACVTQTLWQMTEAASFPIIVAMLGARFGRMLAHSNYSVSPGWAVADPVLRAIVAATFAHVSYGLMVQTHAAAELLAVLLFGKITAAGGVTGAWLAFPSLGGGFLLADIIYWLYSIYIFFLFLASLIGFQICVVLAPLVIPFWVYSGQNQVFSWFAKTVGGALALPIALAVGWGIVIDMVHQMAVTSPGQQSGLGGPVGLAAWMLTVIVIGAGVWFMSKFVRATTGELFSGHLLSTLFLAESTLLMSSRLAGAAMPSRMKDAASRRVLGMNRGGWMPTGLVRGAEQHLMGRTSLVGAARQEIATNGQVRDGVADLLTDAELAQPVLIQLQNAHASAMKGGNLRNAQSIAEQFTDARHEQLLMDAFARLPANRKVEVARQALALSSRAGAGRLATGRFGDHVQRGRARVKSIYDPQVNPEVSSFLDALTNATRQQELRPDVLEDLRHVPEPTHVNIRS
jgi:hypothetical protein